MTIDLSELSDSDETDLLEGTRGQHHINVISCPDFFRVYPKPLRGEERENITRVQTCLPPLPHTSAPPLER